MRQEIVPHFFSVDNYKSFASSPTPYALDGFSVSNVRKVFRFLYSGPWETIRRLGFLPSGERESHEDGKRSISFRGVNEDALG